MSTFGNVVVGLIALVHVYILALEMFLWDKPAGLRAFGQTREAGTPAQGEGQQDGGATMQRFHRVNLLSSGEDAPGIS